jgi:hypothetical protein
MIPDKLAGTIGRA